MSVPSITLMSGVQTEIDPDICFTLDSADLGVLDTNILQGTEDSPFVAPIQSIVISRARSRQLDRFTAGSASIVFDNRDRKLDPLNQNSEYAGYIVPRLRMKILADNIPIFSGVTTDWEIEYDKTYQDVASVSLIDAFTVLSNFQFSNDAIPASQFPGERIEWVLSQFAYSGATNIAAGNALLGTYQIDSGTQALDYMFQIARSDRGIIFVNAAGAFEFVGRFDRDPISEITFADDGTGIPYMSLQTKYNDELLYNQVTVSSPSGSVTVQDDVSIEQFGLSSLVLSNLLNSQLFELRDIAQEMLEKLYIPRVQFTGLSIELAGLSAAQIEDVLNLDLADQVSVKKSFQSGSPSYFVDDLFISGITHQIRPGSHVIDYLFEPTPYKYGLRLDDAVRGTIDEDNYLG